jgi:tRNA modification GTPase
VRESLDEVERIGIARTRRHAAEADLLIAVFDGSRPLEAEDSAVIALAADRPGIALLNKRDLPARATAADLLSAGIKLPVLQFSAATGSGAHELRDRIAAQTEELAGGASDTVAISRERHREALSRALDALDSAKRDALAAMPPEIVALDMAIAAEALASITGQVSTEDVLDAVFREFCIGK